MIINQKVINLKQLNNLILECTLPNFESEHSQSNNSGDFIECEKKDTEKTFIYIYDNQRLFCPPIPFEIKKPQVKENDQTGK